MTDQDKLERIKAELLDEIDAHSDESAAALREFVRIPCVYKDIPALVRASEFIADVLNGAGVDGKLIESGSPGKRSVLGRVAGIRPEAGRSLILNGHMDIYPPSRVWSMDPFSGEIRDGRVYGQGVTDMKSGILAMTLAVSYLARKGIKLCGDLFLHAIPNHYNGGDGTRTALSSGLRADFAVVGEPTDMKVAIAQNGILYVNVTVRGVPTHVTAQDMGVHSVTHAGRLVEALNKVRFPPSDEDSIAGRCHLNISAIHAEGLHRSLMPEECTLTADLRFTPSLGRDGAYQLVERVVDSYAQTESGLKIDLAVDPTCIRNPRNATAVAADAEISRIVSRCVAEVSGRPSEFICHPAWPDTPVFNDMGVQAITFGPGSTACYWPDEYVDTDDFLKAIKVYALVALDACQCDVPG